MARLSIPTQDYLAEMFCRQKCVPVEEINLRQSRRLSNYFFQLKKELLFHHHRSVDVVSSSSGRSTTTLGRSIDRIEMNIESIESQKTQNVTFEGIKPIVPGFFRIGIRFERISGRSAQFLQKLHFSFLKLLGKLN